MSSSRKKARLRRQNRQASTSRGRRCVEWREDGTRIEVVSQHKGYDVAMISDFLAQLLLEVRVQYYENLEMLKVLDRTESGLPSFEAVPPVPKLVEQLRKSLGKYCTSLISVTRIDQGGISDEHMSHVAKAVLRAKSQLRDEQIGHLEALRDLFAEALQCARLPFGATRGGVVQPCQTIDAPAVLEELKALVAEGRP